MKMVISRTPLQIGIMKVTVPKDGQCHPIVGRSYDEQREHQISLVAGILTGSNGMLPDLPGDKMPGPPFWNKLRQGQIHASEVQNAPLSEPVSKTEDESKIPEELINSSRKTTFEEMLAVVPIGQEVIATLWYMNTPDVGRLASASKACSDAIAIYVSRFHLPIGDYQDCDWLPQALIGIDHHRKETIGIGRNLFVRGRDPDVTSGGIKGVPKTWACDRQRANLWNRAQDNKSNVSIYTKLFSFLVCDEQLHAAEIALETSCHDQDLLPQDRGRGSRHHYLREISYNIPMLRALHQYGAGLKAIRLHEVPMLDTRIVEMILSTCPRLEDLGIINCELLHIGDINPLLDLTYWNAKKAARKPVNLQFYPRAYSGPHDNRQGTHIVSWDPLTVDVQTGILATVLLAVLKAIPMGIDLVSKDRPFRKFLDLVPMKLGTSAVFMHHLFTWIDARQSTESYFALPTNIQDDLEDQVMLSMLQGCKHQMAYHSRKTYFSKHTCCRCGYTMVKLLFRREMDLRPESQRVCRPCDLRYALDGERHHRLGEKTSLLSSLLYSSDDPEHRQYEPTEEELQEVMAPLLSNDFIYPPALRNVHRVNALERHIFLPKTQDFIDPMRDYDVLRASGQAAILDVVNRLKESKGIYEDHPTLARQKPSRTNKWACKQSWEYVIWKDTVKDKEEHRKASFW